MTDMKMLERVLGVLDPHPSSLYGLQKNGRLLLALPKDQEAAQRTLRLYQPQRGLARGLVALLRGATALGLQSWLLPRLPVSPEVENLTPPLCGIEAGRCGVMLGSPEHRVRRAIACVRTVNGWEVAKVAAGETGRAMIHDEAAVLGSFPTGTLGVPPLLGVHRVQDLTLLRLPLFTGKSLRPADWTSALTLLESWLLDRPQRPITDFSEWPAIKHALASTAIGRRAMEQLAGCSLRPAIRHGDFARWNILRGSNGELMVVDWEWGTADGMPGLDLVHFFAQEARLVRRMSPPDVIVYVRRALQREECQLYLAATGMDPESAMLACFALTVGAGQQANEEVLVCLLESMSYAPSAQP